MAEAAVSGLVGTVEAPDGAAIKDRFDAVRAEVAKVLVGQDDLVHRLLLALLADGHVLLEGVPGLAKTLAIGTLASTVDCRFSRIQFTPDMLPGDVTGTRRYSTPAKAPTRCARGRCSAISCWPTRSTAPPPKCRPRCWRPCRSVRSRWARKPSLSTIRS